MELYDKLNGYAETISSVVLRDGKMEVVKRYKSGKFYAVYPPRPVPDRVIKCIYGVKNNEIVLEEEIEGKHIPSYRVEESITFDE